MRLEAFASFPLPSILRSLDRFGVFNDIAKSLGTLVESPPPSACVDGPALMSEEKNLSMRAGITL